MYDAIVLEIEKLHMEYYQTPYEMKVAANELLNEYARLQRIISKLSSRMFDLEKYNYKK